MSETLEVVFEDVCQQAATELLWHLVSRADKVTDAEISKNGFETRSHLIGKEELNTAFGDAEDATALFQVSGLRLGDVKLSLSLIRLVKYGQKYDVDFSFDGGTRVEACALMKDLRGEAKALARIFNVRSFFGGLEPASDVKTQYFCDEHEGPLMCG